MTAADSLLHATRSIYPGDAATVVAANVAAQVAAVVVAAWATSRFAGRFAGAAARHGVWLCALSCVIAVMAATAALPSSAVALIRFPAPRADTAADADASAMAATDAPAGEVPAAPSTPPDGPRAAGLGASPQRAARATSTASEQRATRPVGATLRAVGGAMTGVWLVGVTLLTLRLILGWRRLAALRGEAASAAEAVPPDVLRSVRRALGLADDRPLPPLLVSDNVFSPITFGLVHPVVLLPVGLTERLPTSQLRDVLVHEYAHVLRRDHLVGLVQRLVSILLWPHPLVHLLNRELNRAREESCDDYVLGAQPPGRHRAAAEYARALVALAEMRGPRASHPLTPTNPLNPLRPALPAVGILGAGWPLESRVAGLLDQRRKVMTRLNRRARLLLALGLVLAATAAASVRLLGAAPGRGDRPPSPRAKPLANPPADAAKPTTRDAAAHVATLLERPVKNIQLPGISFSDALTFLRDVSGLNMVVDWRALEEAGIDQNTPVEYKAKEARLGAVLKAVTTLAGDANTPVTYGLVGETVFVSTAEDVAAAVKGAAALPAKAKDPPSKELMARSLTELNFSDIALADAVDFLRDLSGGTLFVHWKELEAAGVDRNVPVRIRLFNIRFDQALYLVLRVSTGGKADYTIEDRQIMITSAAALAGPGPKAEKKPATAPARATGK